MTHETYRIPSRSHQIEHVVSRSRFIASAGFTPSIDEARQFIHRVRDAMPDASHHVYGFRVGFGRSITEGMSDDGEPTGTAGPPVLSVVRGSAIGDLTVVVTRYFGGTLLGTGGLVRAYTEAAQLVLADLPTTLNIPVVTFGIALPYPIFDQAVRLIEAHEGQITDKDFGSDITLIITMPETHYPSFTVAMRDLSSGAVTPVIMD